MQIHRSGMTITDVTDELDNPDVTIVYDNPLKMSPKSSTDSMLASTMPPSPGGGMFGWWSGLELWVVSGRSQVRTPSCFSGGSIWQAGRRTSARSPTGRRNRVVSQSLVQNPTAYQSGNMFVILTKFLILCKFSSFRVPQFRSEFSDYLNGTESSLDNYKSTLLSLPMDHQQVGVA